MIIIVYWELCIWWQILMEHKKLQCTNTQSAVLPCTMHMFIRVHFFWPPSLEFDWTLVAVLPFFAFFSHNFFTPDTASCSPVDLSLFSIRASSIPFSRLFISVSLLTWAPPFTFLWSTSLMQNSLCFSSQSFDLHSWLHQLLVRHLLHLLRMFFVIW